MRRPIPSGRPRVAPPGNRALAAFNVAALWICLALAMPVLAAGLMLAGKVAAIIGKG